MPDLLQNKLSTNPLISANLIAEVKMQKPKQLIDDYATLEEYEKRTNHPLFLAALWLPLIFLAIWFIVIIVRTYC